VERQNSKQDKKLAGANDDDEWRRRGSVFSQMLLSRSRTVSAKARQESDEMDDERVLQKRYSALHHMAHSFPPQASRHLCSTHHSSSHAPSSLSRPSTSAIKRVLRIPGARWIIPMCHDRNRSAFYRTNAPTCYKPTIRNREAGLEATNRKSFVQGVE
jgi:hypothetical protein